MLWKGLGHQKPRTRKTRGGERTQGKRSVCVWKADTTRRRPFSLTGVTISPPKKRGRGQDSGGNADFVTMGEKSGRTLEKKQRGKKKRKNSCDAVRGICRLSTEKGKKGTKI